MEAAANPMESTATRDGGEAKVRHELCWLVNEAYVTLNLSSGTSSCCFDMFDDDNAKNEVDVAKRMVELCVSYPRLALEYYVIGDTGEKVGVLETMIRNHLDPTRIQQFCNQFPRALQIQTFASQMYPLHVACEEVPHHGGDDDGPFLIPLLAKGFPPAVESTDNDGNLPLHKVLRRLAKAPRSSSSTTSRREQAPEVEALVELYPEGTIERGMDLAGQDPLHYVLSHQFSPAVMKSILDHVPQTVTQLTLSDSYFAGGMASIHHEYAEAFEEFLPQLEQLIFKPLSTAVMPIFTAEGWMSFFPQLASCPLLNHLEMEIPHGLLREDPPSAFVYAETLPQLVGLKTLILSFPKGRIPTAVVSSAGGQKEDEHNQVILSSPIADLILATGGNLRNLIVKEGVAMDPEPIFNAIMKNQESPLLSLDIRTCSGKDHDLTEPLAGLISSNSPLESLFVKNSKLRPQPIFEALMNNTRLKLLALPHLIVEESPAAAENNTNDSGKSRARNAAATPTASTLSGVLQNHNATLEGITCLQISYQQSQSTENKKIQHYATLNRFGRARARHVKSNRSDMMDLLVAAQRNPSLKNRDKELASVCYGLLRESPERWF